MRELMAALGEPQSAYPVIHLTGTNGKGSVARMVESMLTAMGLRVGLYTSPHLHTPRERIRVGGEPVDEDEFGVAIGDIARVEEVQGLGPLTWFETVTAAALLHFANEAVDVAIVEVGLLGRFDATNVVHAQVAVITNVGKDHTDGQDGWPARIAEEKAGIVEPDAPVVVGAADPALVAIVEAAGPGGLVVRDRDFAVERNEMAVGGRLVDVRTPRGLHEELFVALHGAHQGDNAATAIATVEEFFDAAIGEEVLTEAFAEIEMPGRLEVVHRSPVVLVDAAHNEPAARALADAVEHDFGGGTRRYLVFAMQDGRDPGEVFDALDVGSYELVIPCTAPTPRGVEAAELGRIATDRGARVEVVAHPEAALDHAVGLADDDDLVVVAGSVTLVAIARDLAPEW